VPLRKHSRYGSCNSDAIPTSHRLRWADIDGSGKKVVINAVLTAPALCLRITPATTLHLFSTVPGSGNGN